MLSRSSRLDEKVVMHVDDVILLMTDASSSFGTIKTVGYLDGGDEDLLLLLALLLCFLLSSLASRVNNDKGFSRLSAIFRECASVVDVVVVNTIAPAPDVSSRLATAFGFDAILFPLATAVVLYFEVLGYTVGPSDVDECMRWKETSLPSLLLYSINRPKAYHLVAITCLALTTI